MTKKLVGFFTVSFFFTFTIYPAFLLASEEVVTQAEFTNGEYVPVRPISDDLLSSSESFKQESVIQQAIKEQILIPSSPLSLAEPVSDQVASSAVVQGELQSFESSLFTSLIEPFQSLPQEEPFMTRLSNGVYQMEFDDYFKTLHAELMRQDHTTGFGPVELVNVELAAIRQRVQEGLAGLYDFVVMVPTPGVYQLSSIIPSLFPDEEPGIPGLGVPEKGGIEGIGFPTDDPSLKRVEERFGPIFQELFSSFMDVVKEKGVLQGSVWFDPSAFQSFGFFTSFDYKLSVLLQELGHRWGTFLSSGGKVGNNPLGILGRDSAHWNDFFNSGNSPMDGVKWRDNGNGTFTLERIFGADYRDLANFVFGGTSDVPVVSEFNDFDLYAMGLLAPENVHPSFAIQNPKFLDGSVIDDDFLFAVTNRIAMDPLFRLNPTIQGNRRDISIDDIVAIEGPRNPPAGSGGVQRDFSVAFVILKDQDESVEIVQPILTELNQVTPSLRAIWKQATRNLSTITLGTVPGAFEAFRNTVLQVFDLVLNTIQTGFDPDGNEAGPRRLDDLNREQNRAQANLTSIAELENLLKSVENLLAPLLEASEVLPELKEALGNLPNEITALKTTLTNLHTALENALSKIHDLDNAITLGRSQILVKVNQAESSGILPLGFGRFADSTLDGIDHTYEEVIKALTEASNMFEASREGLRASLNNARDRLDALSDFSPEQVRVRAVEFLDSLLNRAQELNVLKQQAERDLESLRNDQNSLADRIKKVLSAVNQAAVGPQADLQTLLGKVNQLTLPDLEINQALDGTGTLLSNLIQQTILVISDLESLIERNPQAPTLANIVSRLNNAKQGFANVDPKIGDSVQSLISETRSEIESMRTDFRTLFLQFAGSIEELLNLWVASRQASINNLVAARDHLSAKQKSFGKKHADLTSQISGLLDPDVRGAFQKSLDSLGGELTTFEDSLTAKSEDLERLESLFGQLKAQAPDFASIKTWINSSALLNESISSLESKISTLVNAKKLAEGSEAQSINSSINTLTPSIDELTSDVNQLQADLNQLESEIMEAFKEQAEQEAQEKALNEGVDQLKALFEERKQTMNVLFPDLLTRKASLEGQISDFMPLIEALAELVPSASHFALESTALKTALDAFQNQMDIATSDFQTAQALLGDLEIARVNLNQVHSLLSLRQAKDLLSSTQAAFGRTDQVTLLSGQMNAHETEGSRIRDELRTAFLVLSQEREQKLKQFLSSHLEEIDSLSGRTVQAQAVLSSLRSQIAALGAEVEALEDSDIRDALLESIGLAGGSLDEVEDLILEAQGLIPELSDDLIPIHNALGRVLNHSTEVRNGNLFSTSMLNELEAARVLVDTFPEEGVSNPFLNLSQFSSSAFSGLLALPEQIVSDIGLFLHPPVAKAVEEFTHFVIEALRGSEEERESKELFKPTIFGFSARIKARILETEEEERRKKEEEEREYRKRVRGFLVLQDFLERERQDLQVSRRVYPMPVPQIAEFQASQGTKPVIQVEPPLSTE